MLIFKDLIYLLQLSHLLFVPLLLTRVQFFQLLLALRVRQVGTQLLQINLSPVCIVIYYLLQLPSVLPEESSLVAPEVLSDGVKVQLDYVACD